ncbi:SAM-dependent methyltransferase [Actibacterium mucosum KCTC 23349]|uniref:SAM-dependent methyltransferase n=1 Tax=Actibacterium mucosum KCTC 23349 TaxID=1454373 RepID=A0A037ZNP7_9RHOB|nr:methyltransferase domain-containing protein [Actibacterium mucosum]KAJ57280.1 SAM-dependent methyltransferase [Actibacterium mucosum KCTC 23349]
MTETPRLTDRIALRRNRHRALNAPALFLQDDAIDEVKERLIVVNRTFTKTAIVTGFPDHWSTGFPEAQVVTDEPLLDLAEGTHDLVIHGLALHWADDPVGQLVQCRRALQPDGLFIAVMFGGQTLAELRAVLAEAEARLTGGLSPRVLPMAEIRDAGALLQRAGFALPVADGYGRQVHYRNARHLMHDLRAMGEGNALAARHKTPARRALFDMVDEVYATSFPAPGGRITASFEFVVLTGWAPDASQQKPLRPGSAASRLADALNTAEMPLSDAEPKTKI